MPETAVDQQHLFPGQNWNHLCLLGLLFRDITRQPMA